MDERQDESLLRAFNPGPARTATWASATSNPLADIREAVGLMRDAPYPIPCGSEGNPHVVHPRQRPRLMPWAEWSAMGDEKWRVPWAQCGNCGEPLPMKEHR